MRLGTIRINHLAPDPAATDKATMFRPLNVPAGIGPADLNALGVRQAAYPLSSSAPPVIRRNTPCALALRHAGS